MSITLIPEEEMNWAEMCDDPCAIVQDDDEDGWEKVEEKKAVVIKTMPPRAPRWCRDGNACKWRDCGFRHEACSHGRRCRHMKTDPNGCKSPADGGCQYDHRQGHTLMSCKAVIITSESDLWDVFGPLGLDAHSTSCLTMIDMDRAARKMLMDSMELALVSGILCEMEIGSGSKTIWYEFAWNNVDVDPHFSNPEEIIAAEKSLQYWNEQVVLLAAIQDQRILELGEQEVLELEIQEKIYDQEIASKFAAWRGEFMEGD